MRSNKKSAEIGRLKLAHSSEVEQLHLQVRDLNTQKQLFTAKMEAEVAELKSNAAVYKFQIESNFRAQFQEQEKFKEKIAQEKKANKKLLANNQNLRSELSKVQSENANLLCTISELQVDTAEKDGVIQMKDTAAKRKDSELEAKSRALGEKNATISAMSEQITKMREYLTTKQQVSNLMKKIFHPFDSLIYETQTKLSSNQMLALPASKGLTP